MAERVLKELETRGFVVLPSFLSPEEVEAFRQDHAAQPVGTNQNYKVKNASAQANARLGALVQVVLDDVARQTDLRVNAPQGAAYFATGPSTGLNFAWHQDHESYFVLQNHYDYLNFYIPIVKPRPDKSSLSIIPFDTLGRESPRTFRTLFRGGAARFVRVFGMTMAILDDCGRVHRLDVDLERIALTPQLSAGDCLLLRGDVVHRTQDAETERVAISFRAATTHATVNRARLAAGSWEKAVMMSRNSRGYERMFRAFDATGRVEMPLDELMSAMKAIDVPEGKGRRAFVQYLVRQKLGAGVLPRFVASVAATGAVAVASRASKALSRAGGRA